MMISYYELLGRIKNKTNPKRVILDDIVYEWNGVTYYYKKGDSYLSNRLFESGMFDKNIKIIEEDKDIEKLYHKFINQNLRLSSESYKKCRELIRSLIYENSMEIEHLKEKINEIIVEVNRLRKENTDEFMDKKSR